MMQAKMNRKKWRITFTHLSSILQWVKENVKLVVAVQEDSHVTSAEF